MPRRRLEGMLAGLKSCDPCIGSPPVREKELAEVLTILLDHLQGTMYDNVSESIRYHVLYVP